MNRKHPELPNIEDATLRACLAPLMEAMQPPSEPARRSGRMSRQMPTPVESNDNPPPVAVTDMADPGHAPSDSLAEWREMADADFATLRSIGLLLAMSDADLLTAARDFPNQVRGTLARVDRLKQRLSAQYDQVTAATLLLRRALARIDASD